MARMPIPIATIKVINTLSHDQIATLLMICQSSNDLVHRNFTILLLLLDSGIRVSELVSIDLEDVNPTEGRIKIRRGKGNKERLVPPAYTGSAGRQL